MIFLYQSMISTDLHNSTRDDHRDIQDLLLLQLHEKYSMLIHRCTRDPFSVLCAPWFLKPQRYVHNGSQCVSIYLSIYLYIYVCVCARASGFGRLGFALIMSNNNVILAQVP